MSLSLCFAEVSPSLYVRRIRTDGRDFFFRVIAFFFFLKVDWEYNGIIWNDRQATRAMCWENPKDPPASDVSEWKRSDRWFTLFLRCYLCDPEPLACFSTYSGYTQWALLTLVCRTLAPVTWPREFIHGYGHISLFKFCFASVFLPRYRLRACVRICNPVCFLIEGFFQ